MSEDAEVFIQRPLPIFLQLLARIMTGLYFIEVNTEMDPETRYLVFTFLQSVGATFIFWLFPSLVPQPRIVRPYTVAMPHHQSHHQGHHRRESRHRIVRARQECGEKAEAPLSGCDTWPETVLSPEDSLLSLLHMNEETEDTWTRTENWARVERELLDAMKKG